MQKQKEKKAVNDEETLLPLMRLPVTSLCRDRANLTSPCLQRLAQPVILQASRDTAGSAQPQRHRVRASPPSACRLFFLSPLAERNKPREERALSELRRLSPCRAAGGQTETEGEKITEGAISPGFPSPMPPPPPPSPRQDHICITKLVTARGVHARRGRGRRIRRSSLLSKFPPMKLGFLCWSFWN